MQNSYVNENPEYAGFWVRLCAYLIDMAIITVPLLILRLILWGITSSFEGTFLTKGILFQHTISDIIIYLVQVLYFIACTYVSGTTVGKKLLNLKVISPEADKKPELMDIIFRETVGRFLNRFSMNIGYIFIGLDSEKRGFHDFLSDTRVVYTKKVKVYSENHMQSKPIEQNIYAAPVSDAVESLSEEVAPMGESLPSEIEVLPQTYSFVPEQVSDVPEEELWHMPQKRPEEPKEENKVTYSWSQFEYVGDDNKKED